MSRLAVDRPTILRDYIRKTVVRLRRQYTSDRPVQAEILSNLFCQGATITYSGMTVDDPVDGDAVTAVHDVRWTEPSVRIFSALKKAGIDYNDVARGGGAFQAGLPNKRIRRWRDGERELTRDAQRFWELPWWTELGIKYYVDMYQKARERCLQNIAFLDSIRDEKERVEWAIGDRLPTTGTGWHAPLDNREKFGRAMPTYRGQIENVINAYWDDAIEAIERWPTEGSLIRTGALFKGITAGSRSDASPKYVAGDLINDPVFEITTGVREVGTTPDSVTSNSKLTPKEWHRQMFTSMCWPEWLLPMDVNGHIASLTTIPATHPDVDTVNYCELSVDAGYTTDPAVPTFRNGKLDWPNPKERHKFGADNVMKSGIVIDTGDVWLAELVSGGLTTMMQYNISFGLGIRMTADKLGIRFPGGVTQVGDDIAMRMKPEDIPPLMGTIGPWLRTKGMHGKMSFRVGHYVYFPDPDHVLAFLSPRILKTVTSPQELHGAPLLHKGESARLDANAEAQEQAKIFWDQYPWMVLYEGTTADWKNLLEEHFAGGAAQAMVTLGISDWLKYMLPDTKEED